MLAFAGNKNISSFDVVDSAAAISQNLDKLNRERIFLATKKMVEENSEH